MGGSSSGSPPTSMKHRSRSVIKSASALGLSLMISSGKSHFTNASSKNFSQTLLKRISDDAQTSTGYIGHGYNVQSPVGACGGGSSTASSRDTSPCRELSPLVSNLKPPLIIRRGPRGFGFTVHTIRGTIAYYCLIQINLNNNYNYSVLW